MADAEQPGDNNKVAAKTSKGPVADAEGSNKKKFEVKKVRNPRGYNGFALTNTLTAVECSGSLGVGHCR